MKLMDRKQEFAIVLATGKTAFKSASICSAFASISRRSCALARSGSYTATGYGSTRATVKRGGLRQYPRIGQLALKLLF